MQGSGPETSLYTLSEENASEDENFEANVDETFEVNICDRTPGVRYLILRNFEGVSCDQVL